jgi:HK97 family phage portal protein
VLQGIQNHPQNDSAAPINTGHPKKGNNVTAGEWKSFPNFGALNDQRISLRIQKGQHLKFSISLTREKKEGRSSATSGVSNPLEWLIQSLGGAQTSAGVNINHRNSLKYSAVWRAVLGISEMIGSFSFDIFNRLESGGRELALSHRLQPLISSRPSEMLSSQQFRETMQMMALLYGNAYARIKRDGNGFPVELIIINAEKVSVIINQGKKYFRVSGFTDLIDDFDMIHIMGPSLDGITGLSPIAYHRESVGLGIAQNEFLGKFYKNGGFFKGFLKVAGKLDKGKPKEIGEEFDQTWGGANQFRTPVLQSGTEYIPISLPQKDAQTIETANFSIQDISRIFNYPLHKLKSTDQSSYNSNEQENQAFVQENLRVWAAKWEAEYHYKLLNADPRYLVIMNLNDLLRGDIKTRMEQYKTLLPYGVLNADQVREMEGWNPKEDGTGKDYYIMVNLQGKEHEQAQIKKLKKESES